MSKEKTRKRLRCRLGFHDYFADCAMLTVSLCCIDCGHSEDPRLAVQLQRERKAWSDTENISNPNDRMNQVLLRTYAVPINTDLICTDIVAHSQFGGDNDHCLICGGRIAHESVPQHDN